MGFLMGTALLVPPPDPNAPPAFLGFLIALFPMVIVLTGWIIAGCVIYAGRCLSSLSKYTFCIVMAGILCLFMPLGTVLGVFTIIVLMRPAVKGLFSGSERYYLRAWSV